MSKPDAAQPARLLVADDEEGLLFLMVDGLRREGYEVEGVDSGEKALAWLLREKCDLVLLDLKLNDFSATTLVERLRAQGQEFPFIIVTGHGDERTAVEAMKQGALDYVMKDAGMLELLPGVVRRALGVVERDRRLAEAGAAIRQREERHQHVIQTALDGFVRFDRSGHLRELNQAMCELLGYPAADLLERSVFDADGAAFREEVRERVSHLEPNASAHCFTRLQRSDGAEIEVELSLRCDGGDIYGFVHDITDQRRLERQVLEISMEERRQFGRELHDSLGQQLTAIEMMTHTLARELKTLAPPQARTAWEITQYIRRSITQTRELAHGLSPIAAEGEGLMVALHELARMTAATGTGCTFECAKPVKIADAAVAGHLYRIAQEAVTNALKHAKATQIRLKLEKRQRAIELSIEDNGRGFSRANGKKNGMGLQLMHHRARLIGGHLTLHSIAGNGVRVVCALSRKS